MPLYAHNILKIILDKLFEPEERRLNETLIQLNRDHRELSKSPSDGFLYQGKLFIPKQHTVMITVTGKHPVLHVDLFSRMDAHLKDAEIVANDKAQIKLALFNACVDLLEPQGIRDVLPECLVPLVPGLERYQRMRDPGWTLQPGKRNHRQFNIAIPKIEMYAAARLLY